MKELVEVPIASAGGEPAPLTASGPYRVPEPPLEPPPVVAPGLPPPARPWPILGPAAGVYAVLLWSFVVAGQLTTSWMSRGPIPQGAAIGAVFFATLGAFIAGLRRSRLVAPPRTTAHLAGRGFGSLAIAFALFAATLLLATVAGAVVARNPDFPIAFVLVVVAAVAARLATRWTWGGARPPRSPRERFVAVVLWLAGAILTIVAGAELAMNG